jgi:hypothetical protein
MDITEETPNIRSHNAFNAIDHFRASLSTPFDFQSFTDLRCYNIAEITELLTSMRVHTAKLYKRLVFIGLYYEQGDSLLGRYEIDEGYP